MDARCQKRDCFAFTMTKTNHCAILAGIAQDPCKWHKTTAEYLEGLEKYPPSEKYAAGFRPLIKAR